MANCRQFTHRLTAATSLAALVLCIPTVAGSQQTGDSTQAFAKLKTLKGTWDVTERDNPKTKEIATYSMTGGGSVLAEDLRAPAGAPAHAMGHMYTTYYIDKGTLVLTHFCGAGNQPRMRMRSVNDGGARIVFEMYDIANLADPQAFHSNAVEVVFHGEDRVDLVYHGTRSGKQSVQVFQLSRRKTS